MAKVIILIVVFIVSFILSAFFKLKYVYGIKDPIKIKWNDTVGEIYTDISYGAKDSNKFDIYVPADNTKKTYGLVVYLHAGGFTMGDKSEDAKICKYYTSLGFVSAGVNYTLHKNEAPCSVYEMSQEIKRSIPAIKQKAHELGYELDRMAIAGGSAGCGLAYIFAYRDAKESPIPVRMMFGGVGPACFEPREWIGVGAKDDEAAAFCSAMCGTNVTPQMIQNGEYKEALKPVSAYALVTDDAPPSVCAYGVYDKLVPFGASKYLRRSLEEHHIPHEFIVFPKSGHGLQNDAEQMKLYNEKILEYLNKYMAPDKSMAENKANI